jgi:hypothetical protein
MKSRKIKRKTNIKNPMRSLSWIRTAWWPCTWVNGKFSCWLYENTQRTEIKKENK